MSKFFESIFAQFREFYRSLTPTRRVAVAISAIVLLSTIGIMGVMMSKVTYVPFLKNVPSDQLATVIAKLKEKNIPFQLQEDGSTILIPPEFVPATQMTVMAEAGSNKIGNIGLEIFEKQDFAATSYVQRINYQRGLQGELTRAINTLDVVRQSKVILALPPKKTFLEEGGTPKASVVVDIKPGKALTADQIRGITFLVSSAVEGLDPSNVTVVDSNGKVLSKNYGTGGGGMSNEMAELKDKTERQLEERIESILARVVGEGKVIARVSAVIDTRNVSSVEESVDPEKTAIRSVQTEEEKMNGNRTNPTGVPGARANLPGAQDNGEVAFRQDVNKELKMTNYEVPKTVRNIKESPGKIEKISVAVLVDGLASTVTKEDGTQETKWEARSAEDLQKYESLVRNAIGFNDKRGDSLKIENIQFKKEDFTEAQEILSKLERRKLISYLIKWLVIALSLGMFFFLVVRPFMRWLTESFQESIDDLLPKTIEELEELQSVDNSLPGMSSALPMLEESIDPDKAESELLKERIMGLVEKDNTKAAGALSLWLVRKDN